LLTEFNREHLLGSVKIIIKLGESLQPFPRLAKMSAPDDNRNSINYNECPFAGRVCFTDDDLSDY
jgi:hypothetical protein